MRSQAHRDYLLVTVAGAALVAAGPVTAQDDEVERLTKPESTVSLGIGYVSDDAPRFGQYNGLNDQGTYFLGNIDVNWRDDTTGTWIELDGTDLGLDTRELRFNHEKQGDWGYSLEYNQIERVEPYTINTGLTGLGTGTQTVNGTGLRDVTLDKERDIFTLSLKKVLPGDLDINVKVRHEETDGARLFGRGTTGGPGNFYFLTEPLDSNTTQVDAVLGYTTANLQLSGGYYGSFYDNHDVKIDVFGDAGNLAGSPTGTTPDNYVNQFYLNGGYNFTPTTRGNFKVAYSQLKQDSTFILPSVPGTTNLDGDVSTLLFQVGATARPIQDLTLLGDFSYEERDDNTPVLEYRTGYFNEPQSRDTTRGKVEASYRLPMDFRITGGIDYDNIDRSYPASRVARFSNRNEEWTYRAELQRSLSENINGRVSYAHSKRDANLLANVDPGTEVSVVNPLSMGERDRDKVRLMLDWMASEELSLQFAGSYVKDDYPSTGSIIPNAGGSPQPGSFRGPTESKAYHLSVDGAYLINDDWTATAWYSFDKTRFDQITGAQPGNTDIWAVKSTNDTHAVGLGIEGRVTSKLKVGADFSYAYDTGKFNQYAITPTTGLGPIPDVYYRHQSINLFARYEVREDFGVRFDYIHDRWRTNDWQWTGWTYTDGTTVSEDPRQSVNFFGLSAYYKFR